jgi:hypothetical protein
MPFGLCNATTTFMYLMNDVSRNFIDSFVIVLLNDIFLYLYLGIPSLTSQASIKEFEKSENTS